MTQGHEEPAYEPKPEIDQSDPWGHKKALEGVQGLPDKQLLEPSDPWHTREADHLPEPGVDGIRAYDENPTDPQVEDASEPVDAWDAIVKSRELAKAGVFTPKLGSAAATLANLIERQA